MIHVLNNTEKICEYDDQILLIRYTISFCFIWPVDINFIHFTFHLIVLKIKSIEQTAIKKPILTEQSAK